MSPIPRILIATDGSPSAEAALADLQRAGLGPRAKVKVLSVADYWRPPVEALYDGANGWYSSILAGSVAVQQESLRNAKKLAQKAAARLRAKHPGWNISAAAALNSPATAILDEAKKWKATLIVLGSQGHSALGRMVLGSVSHKVLNHAHCGVRIVRPASVRKTIAPQRILVAVDGSKDSDRALRVVARRPWPKNASFRVVTVLDYRLSLAEAFQARAERGKKSPVMHGVPFRGTLAQHLAERAECLLAEQGLKVDAVVRDGDPRHALRLEAKRFQADAIFLGCRGLNALERFFLGSVSQALAEQAPCTVEVVRR